MALKIDNRRKWLAVGAGITVGLLALDNLVLSPLLRHWKDQGARIATLRDAVNNGDLLVGREADLRKRWNDMQRADLNPEVSAAEQDVLKAAARWARDSRILFTSLLPQWRSQDAGHQTLECRATAQGDLNSITRFLRELEKDPLAVRLDSFEITARDDKGRSLTLNARFSAVRLPESRKPRS